MTTSTSGSLVLAATPIGSSRDASESLRALLEEADLIAAEDTRKFVTLLRRLGISAPGRVVSYFEGNEATRTDELVEAVAVGQKVALVTDAGMPSVSDPGFRVVTACIERGLRVTAVPGPSAVLTALALSGLATDRFCFEGFLPRKEGARRARLESLRTEERTMVFFEAPHRLHEFLVTAAEVLGADRPAAVCRELTKPHEEIIREPLGVLADWAAEGVRGEVTLVVAGRDADAPDADDALALVAQRVASGEKLSSAVREVAEITGANRKELYAAALAARGDGRMSK